MNAGQFPSRVLAAGALFLGALAPLAGSPFRASSALDPHGAARVGAVEVAGWLRERRPIHIIDVRDSLRFEEFHLPRAVRLDDDELAALRLTQADTVVLYGDEPVVARAYRALVARPARVLYMIDGVGEWLSDIMNPVIAPDASAEDRVAFAPIAELSRYFGGMPREGVPDSSGTRTLLERTRRRGCAF